MSKTNSKEQTFSCVVEWSKNRTWGWNPHCSAWDAKKQRWIVLRASGCGYDKLSSVLSEWLDSVPEIFAKVQEFSAFPAESLPTGGYVSYRGEAFHAGGACGVNSILDALRSLGITCVHTSGDTSDHFTFSGDFTPRKSIRFVEYSWRGRSAVMSAATFSNYCLRNESAVVRRFIRRVKAVAK